LGSACPKILLLKPAQESGDHDLYRMILGRVKDLLRNDMSARTFQRSSLRLLATFAMLCLVIIEATPQGTPPAELAKPVTAEAHLSMGYDALKVDQYDVAVREFRAALTADPALSLRARFPLAVALFELHQSDEARRELELVRREVGDHPNVFYYLGRLDLDDHKYASAVQNLKLAAVKAPFPDTAYFLGYAYFKQGDLPAAEKWLREASHVTPRDARVPYQLGLVYRKLGREQEATKSLALSEELRRRDSDESRTRLECRQKLDQGLRDEARRVCEQLYDPDNADKLTELGTIYGQHGDPEAALKPLRRAAELAPHSPQMQYNLALTYYQLNQFEQARGPLANSLQRWPDLFQLNALYGAVLVKLGEDLEAYQALHRAHELNPQDPGTTNLLYGLNLGLAQKSKSAARYSDTLRYLEEASSLRPQEAEPHRRLAEIYSLTSRPAQAAAEQQKADRLTSNPGGLP
jgi:tetratricopeptide (TPR) repeat protein